LTSVKILSELMQLLRILLSSLRKSTANLSTAVNATSAKIYAT